MAKINGSSSKNGYGFYLNVSESLPTNYITTNKTNVTVSAVITNGNVRTNSNGWNFNVSCNGQSYSLSSQTLNTTVVDFNKSTTVISHTFEVEHNADGSKSVSVSGSLSKSYYSSYDPGACSASGSITLTTIPRASTPSVDAPITLGTQGTIKSNRASDSFTHTIVIKDGDAIVETFTNVGSTQSWTPTIANYAGRITEAESKQFKMLCTTFNDTQNLGDKEGLVTLVVPTSVKPSVSIAISEGNNVVASKNWGCYVQNRSQLNVTLTPTKAYNANIANYQSTVEGTSKSGQTSTSEILKNSGNANVTATVTDVRNHTSDEATTPYTVVPYLKPSITTASCTRCDSTGKEKDDGTYLKYSFVGSISPVTVSNINKNSKLFRIGYKLKSDSTFTYVTIENSQYTVSKTGQILTGVTLSATDQYDIVFEATDAFETVQIPKEIPTGADILNFNESGKAMAIGKTSEASSNEEKLEIAWDTYFTGAIYLEGTKLFWYE